MLKWPNDLMVGAAKLAGILIEREGEAAVIGFGVNLAYAPEALGRPCTSLCLLGVDPPAPQDFVERLAVSLASWLVRWREISFDALRSEWLARAHPRGAALSVRQGERAINGAFAGLGPDGALILKLPDGSEVTVYAGDVGLG